MALVSVAFPTVLVEPIICYDDKVVKRIFDTKNTLGSLLMLGTRVGNKLCQFSHQQM